MATTRIVESPQERYEGERNRTKQDRLVGRLFQRVLKYFRWNSHKGAIGIRMNERFTLPPSQPPAPLGIHNSFGKLFTVISHLPIAILTWNKDRRGGVRAIVCRCRNVYRSADAGRRFIDLCHSCIDGNTCVRAPICNTTFRVYVSVQRWFAPSNLSAWWQERDETVRGYERLVGRKVRLTASQSCNFSELTFSSDVFSFSIAHAKKVASHFPRE